MQARYIENISPYWQSSRLKSKDLFIENIFAQFYVRLYSFLNFYPQITFEGYEFHIKDTKTGLDFSAGLTGSGPGYFGNPFSFGLNDLIEEFDQELFSEELKLLDCEIAFEHDFGKTILGCKNGIVFKKEEVDI